MSLLYFLLKNEQNWKREIYMCQCKRPALRSVTGFVAKNLKEFTYFAHKLLNDDDLYLKFRENLFKLRNTRNFSHVANDLLKIISN